MVAKYLLKSRKMIALTLQILTLLMTSKASVNGQLIVTCFKHYYLLDGVCRPCPLNCETCVSETECLVCKRGFFGSECEHTCVTWCDSECHKVYGHCRYGCWDGTYSTRDDSLCRQCPVHCPVCESSTHCIACSEGWYGRICQQACPKNCSRCDKSSGKCWQCQDSYYLQHGHCKPCTNGCTYCVSDLPDNSTHTIWQLFLPFFSSAVIICIITVVYLLYKDTQRRNAT